MSKDEASIESTSEMTPQGALDLFPSKEELLSENDAMQAQADSKEEATFESKESQVAENQLDDSQANDVKSAQTKEYSALEQEALDRGWVPQEDFKGSPERWVSAREFVDRSNMLDKITKQNKELNELKSTSNELINLVKKQAEKLSQAEANKILQQKRQAIEDGDVNAAESYERQYNDIQQEIASYNSVPAQNQHIPPEVLDFAERNKSWFNDSTPENIAMKQYAVQLENTLMQQNPTMDTQARLTEVEARVKTFFRDKFENPNRQRAPAVESRTRQVKRDPNKVTYADLPKEAKQIVDQFVRMDRTNKLSADEYAHQLFLSGAIKHD